MATGSLQGAKRRGKVEGSIGAPSVPAEPKKKPNPKTYTGRIALRLRHLRESRGWSGSQLQERLKEAGRTVPLSTIYAYELGSGAGGVDVPLGLLPVYATAFGLKPNGVLPQD